jgi:hypothetical protein
MTTAPTAISSTTTPPAMARYRPVLDDDEALEDGAT